MKKIFLNIIDDKKLAAIRNICAAQQIGIQELKAKDLNHTLASICNISMPAGSAHKKAPAIYGMPELMLFYGINDKALDEFLDAYNALGIEKVKLKAIITPTNLAWTLYELIGELAKEI